MQICLPVDRYHRMVLVVRGRRLAHVPVNSGRVRMAMRAPLGPGRVVHQTRVAGCSAGTMRIAKHVHVRQWRRRADSLFIRTAKEPGNRVLSNPEMSLKGRHVSRG